jgi:hypothetical protein
MGFEEVTAGMWEGLWGSIETVDGKGTSLIPSYAMYMRCNVASPRLFALMRPTTRIRCTMHIYQLKSRLI